MMNIICVNKSKLVIFLAIIIICFSATSAFAWNGNYLMVDGNGDYGQYLGEGPLDVAYNGSKSFTAEFWVLATEYGAIISDDAYDIGYNYDGETFFADVIEFRLYLNGSSILIKRPVDLFNDWHHIVCMFDNINNEAAIGIDGSLTWYEDINDDDGLFNGAFPFLVGSLTQTGGYFTGKIDEVRISDRLRYGGPGYSVPLTPFAADGNTLGLWHFDDSPGFSNFVDSSGNSNHLAAQGDATTVIPSEGGSEIKFYLSDNNLLSEEMGDTIPWKTNYIYPPGSSTSLEWRKTLEEDITGAISYHLDIVESSAPATLKIRFIVERDGSNTTIGSEYIQIAALQPDHYQTYSGSINGLDLDTQSGDILKFIIYYHTGTEKVGIGLDGQAVFNDSHVSIAPQGPEACFAVSPTSGDLNTQFNVNASCSSDDQFPDPSVLQVRWDWENDGHFDTVYAFAKSNNHQFGSVGVKTIILEVKNPQGVTATAQRSITIPALILTSFPVSSPAPVGLAWDGSHLWVSDTNTDKITRRTISGSIVKQIDSPCGDPFDLAWDGTHLWVIDAWGSDGDGNKLYKLNTNGDVVGNPVSVPADYSTGLTWDGQFLWAADSTHNRIAKISPTGEVILAFDSPGPGPRGLAWDGHFLWNSDYSTQKIYQLDVNGNVLDTWASPGTGPMGLTWDGTYLWCVDLNNYRVYQLSNNTQQTASAITCSLSDSNITLGELITTSGEINPVSGETGNGVSIELISPTGEPAYRATLSGINGEYAHTLACGDIDSAGTWTVRSRWSGSDQYSGAVSSNQELQVAKAELRLTLDVSAQAINSGQNITISGKLTPQPDCGGGLKGIPLTLEITGPSGQKTEDAITNDIWGHFVLPDYDGCDGSGNWTIQAHFAGNQAFEAKVSPAIKVKVLESAGYAIIVQGKISSNEGLESHNKTTAFVYKTLRERGLAPEDIKYFNYDMSKIGVDAVPSKSAIQTALTEWAKNRMNTSPGNLYIVLVDHGLDDVFYIHPFTISAVELATWVNTLQGQLDPEAPEQGIVAILGFCRSGSFIDNLSGNNRIVITSAATGESSYKGPLDQDGIRDGEYFITEFFKRVSEGQDIRKCFETARNLTETYTASGDSGTSNAPYFDGSLQHPLLDDNGDGVGSNELSEQTSADGILSQSVVIGIGGATGNAPGDVNLTGIIEPQFLSVGQSTVNTLWARVDNDSRLRSIWLEIKPPGYIPFDSSGSGQAEMRLTYGGVGIYNQLLDRYEWTNIGGFTGEGTYQIIFFTKDDLTGNISSMMSSTVYKQKAGNNPPATFQLYSPADGDIEITTVILDWQNTTDPDGDNLTYQVLLSKEDETFSNPIHIDGILHSTYLVTADDGLEDLSTYYWKVLAIDAYGAIQPSDTRVLHTNNTNLVAGWLNGYVYNAVTGAAITSAQIQTGTATINTADNGYYLDIHQPGIYSLTASAAGYQSKNYSGVNLREFDIVTRDFALTPSGQDTDGDGILDSVENASGCLDPLDVDTDDDGIADGAEDKNHNGVLDSGETDPCDPDSDGDGIQDGTETGVTTAIADPDGAGPLKGTDVGKFKPDEDPLTTTHPLFEDTDFDGVDDGKEDRNWNGRVDAGERDPNFYDLSF